MDEVVPILTSMPKKTFKEFKEKLKDHDTHPDIKKSFSESSTGLESVSKLHKGGGFGKQVKSSLEILSPLHIKNVTQNIIKSLQRKRKMTKLEKEYARMSREVYSDIEDRKDVDGWVNLVDLGDKDHAVYFDGSKLTLAIKGTSSFKDIAPDLAILHGVTSASLDKSLEKYRALKERFAFEWAVTGHSLGGHKAMRIAQEFGDKSYAFNPGFVSFSEDNIDTNYDGHNVFVVKGDPISNSILTRENPNLTVLESKSLRPSQNHGIDNFIDE